MIEFLLHLVEFSLGDGMCGDEFIVRLGHLGPAGEREVVDPAGLSQTMDSTWVVPTWLIRAKEAVEASMRLMLGVLAALILTAPASASDYFGNPTIPASDLVVQGLGTAKVTVWGDLPVTDAVVSDGTQFFIDATFSAPICCAYPTPPHTSVFGTLRYDADAGSDFELAAFSEASTEPVGNGLEMTGVQFQGVVWAMRPEQTTTFTGSLSFVVGMDEVPEPATWAALLVGLMTLGAFLRRERDRHDPQTIRSRSGDEARRVAWVPMRNH